MFFYNIFLFFIARYTKNPVAASLSYSTSSSSSAQSGSISSSNSLGTLDDPRVQNIINHCVDKAQMYNMMDQRRLKEEQQQMLSEFRPPMGIQEMPPHVLYHNNNGDIQALSGVRFSYFSRYREKVVAFIMEISCAYAWRSISKAKYDTYYEKYKQALLQCHEDEAHLTQCRIPCVRCVNMGTGYISAIY